MVGICLPVVVHALLGRGAAFSCAFLPLCFLGSQVGSLFFCFACVVGAMYLPDLGELSSWQRLCALPWADELLYRVAGATTPVTQCRKHNEVSRNDML